MVRKKLSLLISFISVSALVFGQYNPKQLPLPQGPNNASLGRFGEYEVSLFTGVPSISVPLHTIKTNGFEVPIVLSYHASGIKLHDYASWVGLGWALDAGGSIRRKLVGLPDEQAHGLLSGQPLKSINIDAGNSGDVDYLKMLVEGQRDIGADIFSFNFPGGDGRFFFNPDSSYAPIMLPYSPIKIQKTLTGQQLSFKALDRAGNQMLFDNNYAELSNSIIVGTSSSYQTSAWMLEKMISATNKDTIQFTYQSQFDHTPAERSDTWYIDDRISHFEPYQQASSEEDCSGLPYPYDVNPGQQMDPTYSISETFSYVNQEIKFVNGRIVFELDATTRQDFGQTNTSKPLKRIKVYSKSGATEELIKTVEFFYSYFINDYDAASKRLKLDSLQIKGLNNLVAETYRFEYNTSVVLPAITPTTMSKDYWGYYNGRSNTSLVPQMQVDYQATAGSLNDTVTIGTTNVVGREPDSVYVQAAILKKIYFPTKGYTEFEYESNRYLSNSVVKLAGGVRVKSIKSYDGYNPNPLIKFYKYGAGETGNGRSNLTGDFFYFSEESPYEFWSFPCPHPFSHVEGRKNDQKRRRVYSSSPSVGLETFDGAPVVYSEVSEYTSDGSLVNGKTVYRFRDSMDVIDHIPYASKPIISTRHFSRGQLANKKVFKSISTGQFRLVEEQRMAYNSSYSSFAKRGGINVKPQIIRENLSSYEPSYTSSDWYYIDYYIPTDDNYLVADTTLVYNSEDETKYLTTIKTYAYGNVRHQQPITITTKNSVDEEIVSEIRYPADYITSGSTTSNTLLDTMLSRNMQAYPVEMWTRKPGAGVTLSGGLNLYKHQTSGLILLDIQKRLDITGPVSNYQPASIVSSIFTPDSRYKTMLKFPVYETRGNINEVQKENDMKVVYLWGYKGVYPVAKIVGSSYTAVSSLITQSILDNPSDDYTLRSHLAGLRTSLYPVQVTIYTYQPGVGMTSQTDPNGRTTYYQYDFAGRLSMIKDQDGNILKRICYNLAGQAEDCGCISTTATWVNTSTATRCKKNGSNENTGQIEQEQIDVNPCSATFNQLQWVVVGTNYGTCPLPCNIYTCSGNDKKCVNGVCETGIRINVGSDYDFESGMWICYYRYEFSDSSVSEIFSEYTLGPCYFN